MPLRIQLGDKNQCHDKNHCLHNCHEPKVATAVAGSLALASIESCPPGPATTSVTAAAIIVALPRTRPISPASISEARLVIVESVVRVYWD